MVHSDIELMKLIFRAGALARRDDCRPSCDEQKCKDDQSDENNHHKRGFWRILDILEENDGQTQCEIAKRLCIRPQSLSEALTLLETRGYIERRPNENDKREMLVFITENGITAHKSARENREKHAKAYLASLSDEEKENLVMILSKLISANSN